MSDGTAPWNTSVTDGGASGGASPREDRVAHEDGIPIVVRIVCLLGGLTALLTFFAGVYYWWQAPHMHTLGGALLILLACGKATAMWGLWHARPWAWIVTMVIVPLAMAAEFVRLLSGDASATYALLGDLVVIGYVGKRKGTYAPDLQLTPG